MPLLVEALAEAPAAGRGVVLKGGVGGVGLAVEALAMDAAAAGQGGDVAVAAVKDGGGAGEALGGGYAGHGG